MIKKEQNSKTELKIVVKVKMDATKILTEITTKNFKNKQYED